MCPVHWASHMFGFWEGRHFLNGNQDQPRWPGLAIDSNQGPAGGEIGGKMWGTGESRRKRSQQGWGRERDHTPWAAGVQDGWKSPHPSEPRPQNPGLVGGSLPFLDSLAESSGYVTSVWSVTGRGTYLV